MSCKSVSVLLYISNLMLAPFCSNKADCLLQKPLRGDQNIGKVFNYRAVVFDVDLPLTPVLLPIGTDHTMVVFYVAFQVPFLGHFLHIGPDLRAC